MNIQNKYWFRCTNCNSVIKKLTFCPNCLVIEIKDAA